MLAFLRLLALHTPPPHPPPPLETILILGLSLWLDFQYIFRAYPWHPNFFGNLSCTFTPKMSFGKSWIWVEAIFFIWRPYWILVFKFECHPFKLFLVYKKNIVLYLCQHFGLLNKTYTKQWARFVCKRSAILNLAAILDFGTETEMVPNLDVFRIKKPSSVPIFTTFSQFEQSLGIVSPICSTIQGGPERMQQLWSLISRRSSIKTNLFFLFYWVEN